MNWVLPFRQRFVFSALGLVAERGMSVNSWFGCLSFFSSLAAGDGVLGVLVYRVKLQVLCLFLVCLFFFFYFFQAHLPLKLSVVWSWEELFLLNKQAGERVEVQMRKTMRKSRILYHL